MIRKARRDEYSALIEIWSEAVSATHKFLAESDFQEILSQMPAYLDAVDLYVYEKDGTAKGFLGIGGDNIDMLFVGQRGRGIGTQLLRYAIDELRCRKIDVNEQNTAALEFYRRKGFEIVGRSQKDSGGRPYPILHLGLR